MKIKDGLELAMNEDFLQGRLYDADGAEENESIEAPRISKVAKKRKTPEEER